MNHSSPTKHRSVIKIWINSSESEIGGLDGLNWKTIGRFFSPVGAQKPRFLCFPYHLNQWLINAVLVGGGSD